MAVYRTAFPREHYTELRNCWLRDDRVTFKAKGLLAYLLSHQEGYKITQAQMVRQGKDGREAVATGLRELEVAGYLTRRRVRSAGRFTEDDYDLADPFDATGKLLPPPAPAQQEIDTDGAQVRGFPDRSGFPDAGEPQRQTRREEDHPENSPLPSGVGAALQAVPDHEPDPHRPAAQRLAAEHYEASGKLGGNRQFLAVRGIVLGALQAGHTEPQVTAALASLRNRGRPVTNATLGPLLADPRLMTAGAGRASGNGHAAYRDADPAAYHQGF